MKPNFTFKWRYAINRIITSILFFVACFLVWFITANVTCNVVLFQMPGAIAIEFRQFVYTIILIFTFVCCFAFFIIVLLFKRQDMDRVFANMDRYQKTELMAAIQKDLEDEKKESDIQRFKEKAK